MALKKHNIVSQFLERDLAYKALHSSATGIYLNCCAQNMKWAA